mgnify:CR=1 FL=1|jgi:hypothetical protein
MDIKEAKALGRRAKADIEAILDKLYTDTGISITDVRVNAIDVTSFGSVSRELRHYVTLSSAMDF